MAGLRERTRTTPCNTSFMLDMRKPSTSQQKPKAHLEDALQHRHHSVACLSRDARADRRVQEVSRSAALRGEVDGGGGLRRSRVLRRCRLKLVGGPAVWIGSSAACCSAVSSSAVMPRLEGGLDCWCDTHLVDWHVDGRPVAVPVTCMPSVRPLRQIEKTKPARAWAATPSAGMNAKLQR